MLEFEGEILRPEKYPNAAYLLVPGDIKGVFGRANPKVKIYFNGHLYRGSIANMGYGSMVIMPKNIRAKVGRSHGDTVHVKIELDTEKREVNLPLVLENALEKQGLLDFFGSLSYSVRKEHARSIAMAKKEETREKRIEKTIKFLKSKKKD